MSKVLDELRDMMLDTRLDGMNEYAVMVIDRFEAKHPGLEDHTIHCKTDGCQAVTHWGGGGWKTGRGRWNVQWWLCPDCAENPHA